MRFSLGLCLALLTTTATAEELSFTWQGQLLFDPSISVPGGTLGSLLAELGGPDALAGTLPVAGRIRYEQTTPAATQNAQLAGYPDALREMVLDLGPVEVAADFTRIAAAAATSRVGMVALANGAFCGDADHCEELGLTAPGWGSQAGTLNDAWHVFVDETGYNRMFGDAFGFMIGRTDAPAEFLPRIQTQYHGLIAVDGMNLLFFSAEGFDFFSTHALPHISELGTPGAIGRSEIAVFLELPGVMDPLRIEGIVTQMQPQ